MGLQPIVFVHGTTMTAADFAGHLVLFGQHGGYTDGEVFGTTYGDAGRTKFQQKTMDCADVKQVSSLLSAFFYFCLDPRLHSSSGRVHELLRSDPRLQHGRGD